MFWPKSKNRNLSTQTMIENHRKSNARWLTGRFTLFSATLQAVFSFVTVATITVTTASHVKVLHISPTRERVPVVFSHGYSSSIIFSHSGHNISRHSTNADNGNLPARGALQCGRQNYTVAAISRFLKITGLSCRISSLL